MEVNWKELGIIAIIIILLIAAMGVIHAYAEEDYSYAVVEYEGGPDSNVTVADKGSIQGTYLIEVHQGDTVFWGDVCDLRLVEGWYGKLVHKSTGRIVDISSFTHKILIDEAVFPAGEWDQWSDFDFDEDQGNTVAFYVEPHARPEVSFNQSNETPLMALKPYIQPVPVKHVSDYVIAKGDSLNLSVPNYSRVWMFGRVDGFYGLPSVNGTVLIESGEIANLTSGNYILVIDTPGNGSVNVHMKYDEENDRIVYFDPVSFNISYIELFGLDPKTRLDKFRLIEGMTNDTYIEQEVVVGEPEVEIVSLDQIYFRNNTAAQTIRGYTNVGIGTKLTIIVDEDKHFGRDLKYSTFYTTVEGDEKNPGNMRWFETTIPLLFDNYAAGHHTITVKTAIGGSSNVDFDVYESPEHSFIPNNTIKYVNGSEWRPDPTPIIIEKVVTQIIVEKETILVPVTPSQESVKQGQYDAALSLILQIVAVIAILVIVAFFVWYIVWLIIRWRDCRRQEK